ncbi:predicted protein [Plenodomus lingam JN3]|uniref:Predicted protein n=1 Tax=Leptosphaeria maculans (strain JN3 / isolate v23.1.3 / race Av1-4-5-6-7-8) TaxID=985895 RepID=E5A974_LEPMJ|nr:predicted protein [Plenodomus lingam JN3]CBY00215.1 predicted protein [Plenodomus lingam JN3]
MHYYVSWAILSLILAQGLPGGAGTPSVCHLGGE